MMDDERNKKGYNLARKECLLRATDDKKNDDICTLKPNPFNKPLFFGLCRKDLYNTCPLYKFIRWVKNFDK